MIYSSVPALSACNYRLSDRMTTLAFLGAAHIHTPNFVAKMQARTDMCTAWVWDHDLERATASAAKLGARPTTDLLEALPSDVDAVVVCTETSRHETVVMSAIASGKHLFVEKPLGIAAADAWRMQRAIDAAGVMFQTGFFTRGNPIYLHIKQLLQDGALGRITRIRHSNCHAGALRGWFDTQWRWMADPAQAGVGAFGDLGAHSLDLLLWLMGDVTAATADIHVATGRYGDCDEYGEGLLRFANGATGSIAAGWVDVANPATFLISGTEGVAHVTNGQLFIHCNAISGADGKTPWVDLPPAWPHAFDQFLDALAARGTQDERDALSALITTREAAYGSAVMAALYQGARESRWVAPTT